MKRRREEENKGSCYRATRDDKEAQPGGRGPERELEDRTLRTRKTSEPTFKRERRWGGIHELDGTPCLPFGWQGTVQLI